MPVEAVQIAFFVIQQAIAEEPAIAADLQKLFSGGIPTADDWAALRAGIAAETYGQFVPGSQLSNPNA